MPVPPWEQQGAMPPGLVMATKVPATFAAVVSPARPPGAPAYERLLLVSSRVHEPQKVWMQGMWVCSLRWWCTTGRSAHCSSYHNTAPNAPSLTKPFPSSCALAWQVVDAAQPNVAVVVYDWKNFTLQELLSYIKKAVGSGKVQSVGVVAPGTKPGAVALLDGAATTDRKLQEGGELAQFWKILAGYACPPAGTPAVAAGGAGPRLDLLACRVLEAPQEGAALLRELTRQTGVSFAASDDALSGYLLTTYFEDPANNGALTLISSTVQALGMYFKR